MRGARIAEKELIERAKRQAYREAVALAQAQALEQEAEWRAEEEACLARSLGKRSGFFEDQLEVRKQQLDQFGKRYSELRALMQGVEAPSRGAWPSGSSSGRRGWNRPGRRAKQSGQ